MIFTFSLIRHFFVILAVKNLIKVKANVKQFCRIFWLKHLLKHGHLTRRVVRDIILGIIHVLRIHVLGAYSLPLWDQVLSALTVIKNCIFCPPPFLWLRHRWMFHRDHSGIKSAKRWVGSENGNFCWFTVLFMLT